MPDIQDVENSIVALAASVLVPVVAPYVPGTVAMDLLGNKYRIYRGWPQGDIIESDAKSNITDISMAPIPNTFRNTSRILSKWYFPTPTVTPSMGVTMLKNVVTFTGVPALGLVVGVVSNRIGYRHQLTALDTLTSVAAALGSAIPGATASGPVLNLPYGQTAQAAVVFNTSIAYKEFSRQTVHDRITIWAPTNDQRDAISIALINIFAQTPFLTVPWVAGVPACSGVSTARFISDSLVNNDDAIQSAIFRRDLIYTLEWPTVVPEIVPTMAFPVQTPGEPAYPMGSVVNVP